MQHVYPIPPGLGMLRETAMRFQLVQAWYAAAREEATAWP